MKWTEKEQFMSRDYVQVLCTVTQNNYLFVEQMGTSHNGSEVEEAMDVEAGQFEDAEEDP